MTDPGSLAARVKYQELVAPLAKVKDDPLLIGICLDGGLGWWDESVFLRVLRQSASKERSGSGEAIVDPLLAYDRRVLWAADRFNRNRSFLAAYELSQQPGAGAFLARNSGEAVEVNHLIEIFCDDQAIQLGFETVPGKRLVRLVEKGTVTVEAVKQNLLCVNAYDGAVSLKKGWRDAS